MSGLVWDEQSSHSRKQHTSFLNLLNLQDKKRFKPAWKSLCTEYSENHCIQVFDELAALYNSPDRYYHTDSHIHHCLNELDSAVMTASNPTHIEMAIWCHDVVYTPGDPDNEIKSAAWFKSHANAHISPSDIQIVFNLITITEHRDSPVTHDEKLMVDIDLSSLGLPKEKFKTDGERVRQEFPEMSDREFIEGQKKFLESLIQRPSLYCTDYFQKQYELAAQKNITQLLKQYETILNQ